MLFVHFYYFTSELRPLVHFFVTKYNANCTKLWKFYGQSYVIMFCTMQGKTQKFVKIYLLVNYIMKWNVCAH